MANGWEVVSVWTARQKCVVKVVKNIVLTHTNTLSQTHTRLPESNSQHTITWAPAFVLAVINTPPEFDPRIYWSNQIWHAISKALFMKDILMQIKPKRGNVKYPSFKITHLADFFSPPVLNAPSSLWWRHLYWKTKSKGPWLRLCQIIEWQGKNGAWF